MKKRILAMFLACMMVLSVIAVPAFAAEEECTHKNKTYGTILKGEKLPETCADETAVAEWTCPDCGASDVELVVGEHKTTTSFTDATCEAPSKVTTACACGEVADTKEVGEALGHNYVLDDDNKENVVPDCGKDGSFVYECTRCGDTETRTTGGFEHNYEAVENGYVAPTCSKPSGFKFECSLCGDVIVKYTKEGDAGYEPTIAHTVRVNPKKDATCKADGYTEWKDCSVCGAVIVAKETIKKDANAHKEELKVTLKEATCTTDGVGQYHCSICKTDLGYKVIKGGHDWVLDASKSVAPKCGVDGKNVYKCSKGCTGEGATKEEKVPATNASHTWVAYNDETKFIDATCDEPAKIKAGKYCSACKIDDKGVVVTVLKDMPALGHDEVKVTDFEGGKAPGCGEAGTYYLTCSRCDWTLGSAKNPLHDEVVTQHNYQPIANGYVAPTCTKTAGFKNVCSLCKDEEVIYTKVGDVGYEPTIAHTVRVNPKKDATCKADGWKEWKDCSVCGAVIVAKETIKKDADAHVWKLKTTLKPATCTVDGVGEYACENNCGVENTFDTIKAAHTWNTESLLVSENSQAIYNPCKACDAVVVYKYFGELAEGETADDYVGKTIPNVKIAADIAVTGSVLEENLKNSVLLTVVVSGVDAAYGNIWLEVDGTAKIMGYTVNNGVYTFICRVNVNNIANNFNFVVKSNTYGVVCASNAKTFNFAQYDGTFTFTGEADKALTGATASFTGKGVFINENAQLAFVADGAIEGASIVLKKDGKVFATKAIVSKNEAVKFDLTAADWDTEFEVYIVDANDKVISDTIYYSVAEYASNKLNNNTDDKLLDAVLSAMMQAIKD